MVDRYTKIMLTVIALALVALAARPAFETRVARTGEPVDVRIVGIGGYFPFSALPVSCVDGCKSFSSN